jgi:hypothetical protein
MIWVGIKQGKREVFEYMRTPTKESHGEKYNAVIGAFASHAGAELMASPAGYNNPHIQTVDDAERIAHANKRDNK